PAPFVPSPPASALPQPPRSHPCYRRPAGRGSESLRWSPASRRNLTRLSERPPTISSMRYHHTKNKGDLGLVKAMADLAAKGWSILMPLTEHEAFDLVAYRDGRFLRVQVKYRAAAKGAIVFPITTCWADR